MLKPLEELKALEVVLAKSWSTSDYSLEFNTRWNKQIKESYFDHYRRIALALVDQLDEVLLAGADGNKSHGVEVTRLEKVVEAQQDLINFYDQYIGKVTPYLVGHRVGPTTDEIDKGEKLRRQVYEAKDE